MASVVLTTRNTHDPRNPAGWGERPCGRVAEVSNSTIAVLLFALGGFLIGGVYATWKSVKFIAVVLGLGALLAIGGAIAWLA